MDNERITVETPALLLNHGYQYTSLIGEGSNGKTYRAKNLKTGEIVAIKSIKFSDNLKNYELFKREAETLKSINTPGIPKFYDYITDDSEFTECWLVQEFVKGKSILEKIELKARQGFRYTEAETLRLLRECASIIYSLQQDYVPPIIHRDIKPSNILISFKGDKVYLIDFGAVANPTRRSANTTVAGTVGYMAPEQLLGDSAIQSDYFSLGATALHMLTGIHPSQFPTNNFQINFDEQLKKYCPRLSPNTNALLHRLLEPHTSDRPSNANELISLIDQCINPQIKTKPTPQKGTQIKIQASTVGPKQQIVKDSDSHNEYIYREYRRYKNSANASGFSFVIMLFIAIGIAPLVKSEFAGTVIIIIEGLLVFAMCITLGVLSPRVFSQMQTIKAMLPPEYLALREAQDEAEAKASKTPKSTKASQSDDIQVETYLEYAVDATIEEVHPNMLVCSFMINNLTKAVTIQNDKVEKKYHKRDKLKLYVHAEGNEYVCYTTPSTRA